MSERVSALSRLSLLPAYCQLPAASLSSSGTLPIVALAPLKSPRRFDPTKLPVSRDFALVFDFAEPAGYGLGRSGWMACRFGAGETVDLGLLKRWLAESYRAVAPKKLAALLPEED